MATRYPRRLYSYRRQARSGRSYRFPRRYSTSYRSGARSYRGYGSYGLASIAPYALRAAPYVYRGYKAYQRGGFSGIKRYAGKLASGAARSAIKSVTGYGSYSSVGRGGMQGTQAPSIKNGAAENGTIVISHKEFLTDIRSSSDASGKTFNPLTFRLNPGDTNSFPWLSQISQNFQQYRWEGICFHYKTMSADALSSTNTALGSIILSTYYDATQDQPKSKQEMENTEFAQSIKPSQSVTHFVECAKSQSTLTEMYISNDLNDQKGDVRFYDFGNFTIATEGMQAASVVLGELWVSYQVRLYKPRLWDALGKDVLMFHYGLSDASGDVNNTTPLGVDNWELKGGAAESYNAQNNLAVHDKTSTQVLFKAVGTPKTFVLQIIYIGTSTAGLNLEQKVTDISCGPASRALYATDLHTASERIAPSGFAATGSTEMLLRTVNVDGENTHKPWGWSINTVGLIIPTTNTRFLFNVTEIPYCPN